MHQERSCYLVWAQDVSPVMGIAKRSFSPSTMAKRCDLVFSDSESSEEERWGVVV